MSRQNQTPPTGPQKTAELKLSKDKSLSFDLKAPKKNRQLDDENKPWILVQFPLQNRRMLNSWKSTSWALPT